VSRSWLDQKFGVTTLRLGQDAVWLMQKQGGDADPQLREPVVPEERQDRPAWQAQLSALNRLLQRLGTSVRPTSLKIIVSNAFVRYVIAPWNDQQLSDAEQIELVRVLFQDRYGDRDTKWHIVIEPQRFEMPALAAAIENALQNALQDACTTAGLRLVALAPALIENLHLQRRPLKKASNGWFVDASDGRLAVIACSGGRWTNVSNEPCPDASGNMVGNLVPMLRRDAILTPGLLGGTVFVANTRAALEGISPHWPVVRLNGLDVSPCA